MDLGRTPTRAIKIEEDDNAEGNYNDLVTATSSPSRNPAAPPVDSSFAMIGRQSATVTDLGCYMGTYTIMDTAILRTTLVIRLSFSYHEAATRWETVGSTSES